jgi:hypothetical protein
MRSLQYSSHLWSLSLLFCPEKSNKKGQHRVKNNHDTAQTVGMKTGTGAPVSDTELPAPRWFALHLVRQLQEICLPLC